MKLNKLLINGTHTKMPIRFQSRGGKRSLKNHGSHKIFMKKSKWLGLTNNSTNLSCILAKSLI